MLDNNLNCNKDSVVVIRCCFMLSDGGGDAWCCGGVFVLRLVGLYWCSLDRLSWFIWTQIWCRNGLRTEL